MATLTVHKKTGEEVKVTAEPVQVPAKRWGDHSQLATVDAFGNPAAQVSPAPRGGTISPPPSRNFR